MTKHRHNGAHGIYEISEIARYTGRHSSTVRSWLRWLPTKEQTRLSESEYPVGNGRRFFSFLDLIEVYVIGQLRDLNFPLQSIRSARVDMQMEFGSNQPFAHQCFTSDGSRILCGLESANDEPQRFGAVTNQSEMATLVDDVVTKIEYDQETRLAARWHIARGVVIDPKIGFGKPVIVQTGTATYVVFRAYLANGHDEELVADLYGIAPHRVLEAVEFEESIEQHAAA